ncbi:MAG TPA: MOSC domain-containing protein, partial [Bacillaceae bacterium]
EDDVCIGDIYKIGSTVVQITQGRIPCSTIDRFNQVKGIFKEVIGTGKTGYFGRVLEEGAIERGARIMLIDRSQSEMTVADLNHLFFHDRGNRELIEQAVSIQELAEAMRENFLKLLK